ncbi:MAG: 4-(cytidine 5'-diphospho)-2-C-methyl-D-erythritol kinase [Lysobacteraceae bacterium]
MNLPVGEGWSRWPAPAKLNLFLRIVGRREDGYHLLQTVFQLLDRGDELALRVRPDGVIQRHVGLADLPPAQDLAVRAAQALQRATGCRLGADIAIDKRIPAGAGFGGGSSDAASTLVALNHLWRTGLDIDALAAIGLGLGADVPLFVRGRSAFAEGLGEWLTPLALPPRHYLLLDPGVHVATGEIFQAAELTRNAAPLKIADFVVDSDFGNAFEPVLRRRAPRVDAALTALSRFGRARLTGSGSGCFVAFERIDALEAAREALAPTWTTWRASGVNESPLHARLRALAADQSV